MTIVEICDLSLAAGSNVGDPNNQAAAVTKECCGTIVEQKGVQSLQFGHMMEHPDYLTLLIKWDDIKDHHNFNASDTYKPFVERFSTIFAGAPKIVHADLQPSDGYEKAVSAPVTEVATFYFDGAPPENAYESAIKAIDALAKDGGQKIYGHAYGVTEEVIEREGVKGKGAVLVIGWENREAHMAARETQAFKDNIQGLRNGAQKIEMHHAQFMNFVPS